MQTATFDATIEGRGLLAASAALIGYLAARGSLAPGLVLVRKRRQPISRSSRGVHVTLSAAISFGVQRYRVPFDTVMRCCRRCLEAAWSRLRSKPTTAAEP